MTPSPDVAVRRAVLRPLQHVHYQLENVMTSHVVSEPQLHSTTHRTATTVNVLTFVGAARTVQVNHISMDIERSQ